MQSRATTCALDARVNQPFTRNLLAPGKKLCFGRERFFGVAGRGRRGRRPYSLTQGRAGRESSLGPFPPAFSGEPGRRTTPYPPDYFFGLAKLQRVPVLSRRHPRGKKNSKQAHTKTESQKGQKQKKPGMKKPQFFLLFSFFIF